jgi:DNA-binding GntR family transcriptional regulator
MTERMAHLTPIGSATVVAQAYDQIRAFILGGEMPPGTRLGQVELAGQLGISRTPVREALRRLAGEGLVDSLPNRGFRVADIGLAAVMRRLEIRLLLEPGIARLAAERATPADLRALRKAIELEHKAPDAIAAHDASRAWHVALAQATGNEDLRNTLESLWIIEVGRRLLARRAAAPDWQKADVAEHDEITDAVERGNGAIAERLMREHIAAALRHWQPLAERQDQQSDVAASA